MAAYMIKPLDIYVSSLCGMYFTGEPSRSMEDERTEHEKLCAVCSLFVRVVTP